MAIALVGSVNTYGFADGDSGKTLTHDSGAPSVDHMDVLLINSNTVLDSVTSSAGASWTQRENATDQQGAYIYTRKATGGEPATAVVNTSGNHDTCVHWYRLSGVDAYSDSNFNQATGGATSLDSLTTGTLVATGMAVVTSAMLHNFSTTPSSQSWSNSFTTPGAASSSTTGASNARVALFTSHKLNVGTASETVSGCTWTNNASDRYCVWVAFTAAAGGTDATVNASTVNATTSVPAATVATGSTVSPGGISGTTTVPSAAVSTGSTVVVGAISASASLPAATVATGSTATPAAVAASTTVPNATLSTGSTVTPSAVSGVATMPSPTVAAGSGATVTPSAVNGSASLPSATTSTGSTVSPSAILATTLVLAPSVGLAARATSTASVSARRTSTTAVSARRTSTATVTGG